MCRFLHFVVLGLLALPIAGRAGGDDKQPWRKLPLVKDGKVAPDWVMVGYGTMAVTDDGLRTDCDEKGMGLLLYTKETFGDCQIRVVFKCKDARSNAGVFVRIDGGILDAPALRTPEDAVRSLRRALARRSLPSLERVLARQPRADLEAEIERILDETADDLDHEVEIRGNRARVRLTGGREILLAREAGEWRIVEIR